MITFEDYCKSYSNISTMARGGQKVVFSAQSADNGPVVIKLFFNLDERSEREILIGQSFPIKAMPKMLSTGKLLYENVETLYVVEQKIEGQELRRIISNGHRFSLMEAIDFVEQCLNFIVELEKNAVIHRDIKPENIIIASDGTVYFLDFGIARVLDLPSLTRTEAIMGPHTPGYAAPEQFNNLKKEIDSRSDIFSIGVVAYECITGVNPFRNGANSPLDVLQRTETLTPVIINLEGDTQKQFMGLVCTMMGKYPSRRPKNAEQALDWLNAAKTTCVLREGE